MSHLLLRDIGDDVGGGGGLMLHAFDDNILGTRDATHYCCQNFVVPFCELVYGLGPIDGWYLQAVVGIKGRDSRRWRCTTRC